MAESLSIKYIDTNWLQSNLNAHYTILDFQPDIHDYIKEHIPGAVYINEKHFRCFYQSQPAAYVPSTVIEMIMGQAGLSNSLPVVIYGGNGRFSEQGDGLEQTMAAYTLARFGHQEIYLLNGGIDAWIEADLELEKRFPTVEPKTFITSICNDLFYNYNQFREAKDKSNTVLIDVRPRSVYEGKSIWTKPGHIPGARNLPWRLLMSHSNANHLRPLHQIDELVQEIDVSPSQSVILYCGTGREASSAFIVFKYILNYPDVRIYEGSFTEWCSNLENETVTGPEPYK
jgi:thiosulfate/3-mercaptopyruvate sulfurtransferase